MQKGGHNPLEPAQFGVPVVMGPSFENFRDVVAKMQALNGIEIVKDADGLEGTLQRLLRNHDAAKELGEAGKRVFANEAGATERSVAALHALAVAGAPLDTKRW